METVSHQTEKYQRLIAEDRYKLLQSEVNVRDRIATLKQRLEMKFIRLEQEALSDIRAVVGLEMLKLKNRETCATLQDQAKTSKILVFKENQAIIQMERDISTLGTISLVDAPDISEDAYDEIDAGSTASGDTLSPASDADTIQSSNLSQAASEEASQRAIYESDSSSFLHIHAGEKQASLTSSLSSFSFFTESGTLFRKSNKRKSILDKEGRVSILQSNTGDAELSEQTTPLLKSSVVSVTAGTDIFEKNPILFTVVKNGKIVVLSKTEQNVSLHSSDFTLLTSLAVSKPIGICYHASYDIIAILSRKNDSNFLILVKVDNATLRIKDEVRIKCQTRVSSITCSHSTMYVGCSENHIHVIDQTWRELRMIVYAPLREKMVSIACKGGIFCLVESDGSVTYINSTGMLLSKDSINAICVGFVGSKPFVLCSEPGEPGKIFVIETDPREEESGKAIGTEESGKQRNVIQIELPNAHDMHISADGQLTILYETKGKLSIKKYTSKL